MGKKLLNQKIVEILIVILFAFLFFMISRWTPTAGDDWGYAYNGMNGNAFALTIHNYLTWSGRILAEFWGFTIAEHKHLWDVLNTCLFTGILLLITRFVGNKERSVSSLLLVIVLILSVPNKLRMQTYTWIMGTTYVIPLFLFLIYLFFVRKAIFEKKLNRFERIVCYLLNTMIPLYMENAAGMLVGVNTCIVLYCYMYQKRRLKQFLSFLITSVIFTGVIGLSPGAASRLASDNAAFASLSIFAKIATNWSSFISWTFVEPTILVTVMGIISALYTYQNRNDIKYYQVIMIALLLGSVCTGFPLPTFVSTIIFIAFTIALFVVAYSIKENKEKWMLILILLAAGGANLVMLLSPIFDARSAIYTIFLFILYTASIAKYIVLNKKVNQLVLIVLACTSILLVNHYYGIYSLVHRIDLKRQKQIAYYQVRPDIEEAYILGYPADTIHSADVIPGDDYHDLFFKRYYYLNEEMNVNFYYLDQYTIEEIEAQSE